MNTDKMYKQIRDKITNGVYVSDQLGYFSDDCCALLRAAGATDKQAEKAYNYAYDEGHSSGMSEILIYVGEMVDIFQE